MSGARTFIAGFVACYMMGAVFLGAAGFRAIPCMTKAGAVYYGVLWPLAPLSVAIGRSLYPVPMWACVAPQEPQP